MAVQQLGLAAGIAAANLVGGLLIEPLGWRGVFGVMVGRWTSRDQGSGFRVREPGGRWGQGVGWERAGAGRHASPCVVDRDPSVQVWTPTVSCCNHPIASSTGLWLLLTER
jgi:hypothetical protein